MSNNLKRPNGHKVNQSSQDKRQFFALGRLVCTMYATKSYESDQDRNSWKNTTEKDPVSHALSVIPSCLQHNDSRRVLCTLLDPHPSHINLLQYR